jgi:hypothetical protein
MAGLDPAIHALQRAGCGTWMPGTRPGKTLVDGIRSRWRLVSAALETGL